MGQGKGSVRFEVKEWNAGGAIHFYGSRKPRTFIIEVTITTEVRGELLQQAVEKTLQRMPYYASTLPRILPMTGIIGALRPSWMSLASPAKSCPLHLS